MNLGHEAVSDLLKVTQAWASGVWIRLGLSGSKSHAHICYLALLSWDQFGGSKAKDNLYHESTGVADRAQEKELELRSNCSQALQDLQYALACVIHSTFPQPSHVPENVASIRFQVSQ